MTTQSNVCECETCVGTACTCGCQNSPASSASCQCGEVCHCGQDRLARLSTNSSHRVVPSTHIALVTDQTAARTSIQAIRDVLQAVRSDATLDKTL
jgi:hypothetical protein